MGFGFWEIKIDTNEENKQREQTKRKTNEENISEEINKDKKNKEKNKEKRRKEKKINTNIANFQNDMKYKIM